VGVIRRNLHLQTPFQTDPKWALNVKDESIMYDHEAYQ
jgi:hypothetical protein